MGQEREDTTGAGSTRRIDTMADAVPAIGRHSPRLARLRDLARRTDPQRTVADGLKLVVELARRGVPLEEVFVAEEILPTVLAEPALATVARCGRLFQADGETLDRVAPTRTSQGVLAVVSVSPVPVPVGGVVLFLERVQDPGNVGAVIRAAAALGASGVACSPGCADPYSPRVLRASAGWALGFPVSADAVFSDLAARFAAAGGAAAAAAAAGGTPTTAWRARRPLLLALGNEGQGVSAEVAARCDEVVSIPLSGAVESLNIAVAAGILLAGLGGVAPAPILGMAP